jgi:hypothetical protein
MRLLSIRTRANDASKHKNICNEVTKNKNIGKRCIITNANNLSKNKNKGKRG